MVEVTPAGVTIKDVPEEPLPVSGNIGPVCAVGVELSVSGFCDLEFGTLTDESRTLEPEVDGLRLATEEVWPGPGALFIGGRDTLGV